MAAASSNWRTTAPSNALAPGHGAKRRHPQDNEEADAAQRLAKRFHLLNIENNGRLWVDPNTDSHQMTTSTLRPHETTRHDEHMQIEDTRDRVYIHNLDEELAEVSEDEHDGERIIFIPDIERKLSELPLRAILGEPHERTGNEVVLYSVPKALSVPEEQDSVRRAIIESRARKRHEQAQPSRDALLHQDASDVAEADICEDDDAMDLE